MSLEHRDTLVNELSRAASAYLRSAMHQPVAWNEWGEAAFARAVAEDKPILLDIGAVWCHWCHVMDRESYENAEMAEVINKFFVPIKVDRDERPDVDARYQAAVSSISGQGGWPLTAFLTPEGLPYFGGTYFPPEDRAGRPGLRRVLFTMAEAFQKKRAEVEESAGSVMAAIEHNESFAAPAEGLAEEHGPELVRKLIASALAQFDARFGGFGSQPKFPHAGGIDLLLDAAGHGDEEAKRAATVTLEKMANGGIYDQLAGGFHRYSVDERWVVPHFEKMSYDNSELLRNYVHAFQSYGDEAMARVAREIVGWVDEWLSDRERGGFYASQDADFSLEDDGDYFTWTLAEAAAVLTAEELAIAAPFYDIGEVGDMQHDPSRNVLHVNLPLSVVAAPKNRPVSMPVAEAEGVLASARAKLYAARLKRPTPFVDKTVYTGWNAMMVSAYLEAGRVLGVTEAKAFGLKTLDRILGEAWDGASLRHVVAYGEGTAAGVRVAGVLEDYVFLGNAALDGWEATGAMRYYEAAVGLADAAIAKFYDKADGAFFDTEAAAAGERRWGALTTRRKPLQDSPTPAGNSVAAALLLRLYALSGKAEYAGCATETLENFAGVVEHLGLYAASYGLALQRMVTLPVQVCVVGEDALADTLERAALQRFAVNKSVVRLRREQMGALPAALAETLPHLPQLLDREESFAVLCSGNTCQAPTGSVAELMGILGQTV